MKKKENLFNFDSIPLSKTKESYLNINCQNPLPNLQPAKNNIIQIFKCNNLRQIKQKVKILFLINMLLQVYIFLLENMNKKKKNNLKEYRLRLLSAGSTSYNNVIIPMISLTQQPSGFFNENEKSFGYDNLKRSRKYFSEKFVAIFFTNRSHAITLQFSDS